MTLNHDEKAMEIICRIHGQDISDEAQSRVILGILSSKELMTIISGYLKEVEEEAFARGVEKKASCVCMRTPVGDAYCELHRPMFDGLQSRLTKANELLSEVIRKAQESLSAIRKYRSG